MADSEFKLIIVTGMSGAGKSLTANALEDIGFYCIDNIPPVLIPSIIDLSLKGSANLSKVAVITDLRGGEMFNEIDETIATLKHRGITPKVLFLDASDSELSRRYKESRRSHPLSMALNLSLDEGISKERECLKPIRTKADYIIDTTYYSSNQLKQRLFDVFNIDKQLSFNVQIVTFGFKHGPCTDADLVFDVRCLPNPFYIDTLRNLTGMDKEVNDYVMSFPQSQELADKLTDLIDFLVPLYQNEGKSQLIIGVGCTGGKHRSVTVARILNDFLTSKGFSSSLTNRDINK